MAPTSLDPYLLDPDPLAAAAPPLLIVSTAMSLTAPKMCPMTSPVVYTQQVVSIQRVSGSL
jgi:hypothetical protein